MSDLIDSDYVDRTRVGRRKAYSIRTELPISLPSQRDVRLGALLPARARAGRPEPLALG